MNYFLDSSALVKLYHDEQGSTRVDALFRQAESTFCVSRLAIGETLSAVYARAREGTLDRSRLALAIRRVKSDVESGRFIIVKVTEPRLTEAEDLIQRHGMSARLRAMDAIHLACAISYRKWEPVDRFVSADRDLCEVARLEGFDILDPTA